LLPCGLLLVNAVRRPSVESLDKSGHVTVAFDPVETPLGGYEADA
jgi:hypothetical protein